MYVYIVNIENTHPIILTETFCVDIPNLLQPNQLPDYTHFEI